MYRRAKDKAVGLLRLLCKFVDRAAEDALARLRAAAARDAAAGRLVADPEDLGVDPLRLQRPRDLPQCRIGAAIPVRAAIDQQNFHKIILLGWVFFFHTTNLKRMQGKRAR